MKISSTNRAFNFCFLLALGLAFWPIAVRAQTPIACGQTIASNTVANSEVDQYTYAGTAGQVISVALYGPLGCSCSGNATISADIYSPGGQYLTSVTTAYYGGCNCLYNGGATTLTLTNSGTYTILVHAAAYNASGAYSLSLQSVEGGTCSKPISCGQTIGSNTTFDAEMDTYSYVGTSGQVVSVSMYGPLGCACSINMPISADIYSPGGQYLTSVTTAYYGGCNCLYNGGATTLTLTNSGTYTILVHAAAYNASGAYSLSLQSVTGGGCNSTPIACGQTASSATTNDAEVDAYSIDGCSNDVVILSTSGFSGSEFDLYDPTGKELFSIGPGTSSNVTFSVSGVYTLLVHSSSYNGTGSYGVTLTCLIACTYTTSTVSAQPNGGWTSGGGAIRCCFPVQVCAIPNDCYNFVSWTDPNSDVVSTLPCYTFVATNSETLTAHFAPTRGTTNQICGIQIEGTNVAISAQSVEGDNYQLQSRNSMTAGNWANVSGVVLSNSPGGLIILTNSGGASTTQRFYRFYITP